MIKFWGLMYSMVTTVNNTVLYTCNLLRVNKHPHYKQQQSYYVRS